MKASRGVYVIQIALLLLLVCMLAPAAMAQANFQGRWRTLTPLMPINPVHVALLHTDKVVVIAGSGTCSVMEWWCSRTAVPSPVLLRKALGSL